MRARLLLADDHTLLLEGIRLMLEPEFELVGSVEDGQSLLAAAKALKPDVILAGMEAERGCFLEKLSASGRGEQEQEATAEESRRVILKIRVKAIELEHVKAVVK